MITRFVDPALMHMFVYLNEEGSFTAAAERLHLTQQAVSAQMKRLEELTGRVLVNRNNQRVELTHDGEALLVTAKQVVELSDRIRRQFSAVPLSGVIRFGFSPGLAPSLMLPLLSELRRTHPQLEIRCLTARSSQLQSRLETGGLDIILGAQRAGDLRGEVLRRERLVWVGDIKNLVRPDAAIPLVMLPSPTFVREQIFNSLNQAGLKWTIHSECDDPMTMRAAVQAGWGISVFNEELILSEPSFPHDDGTSILPDPGCVEFFMSFNSTNRNASIDSLADILRSTLAFP